MQSSDYTVELAEYAVPFFIDLWIITRRDIISFNPERTLQKENALIPAQMNDKVC